MRFSDVKVGDQVIVTPGGYGRGLRKVCQVERVTATQLTAGGYRFSKQYGQQIGGDHYHSASVQEATPSLVKEVQHEQRYSTAQHVLRQQLNSIEALLIKIGLDHDCHKWAATLEKAHSHLASAMEALKVRQEELEP